MDKQLKKLRSESKNLKHGIIIGKNGINDEVIKNIKKHIKTFGIVKIKVLNNYIEGKDKDYKKSLANELVTKCDAKLIDLVGFTIVLAK